MALFNGLTGSPPGSRALTWLDVHHGIISAVENDRCASSELTQAVDGLIKRDLPKFRPVELGRLRSGLDESMNKIIEQRISSRQPSVDPVDSDDAPLDGGRVEDLYESRLDHELSDPSCDDDAHCESNDAPGEWQEQESPVSDDFMKKCEIVRFLIAEIDKLIAGYTQSRPPMPLPAASASTPQRLRRSPSQASQRSDDTGLYEEIDSFDGSRPIPTTSTQARQEPTSTMPRRHSAHSLASVDTTSSCDSRASEPTTLPLSIWGDPGDPHVLTDPQLLTVEPSVEGQGGPPAAATMPTSDDQRFSSCFPPSANAEIASTASGLDPIATGARSHFDEVLKELREGWVPREGAKPRTDARLRRDPTRPRLTVDEDGVVCVES